jgi:hypothetical protein
MKEFLMADAPKKRLVYFHGLTPVVSSRSKGRVQAALALSLRFRVNRVGGASRLCRRIERTTIHG